MLENPDDASSLDDSLKKKTAAVAEALSRFTNIKDCDLCGSVTELAQKLYRKVGVQALYVSSGTHDWNRVGDFNIDFGAVQYEKPYPYVTNVFSEEAVELYGGGAVDVKGWPDYPHDAAFVTAEEVNRNFPPLVQWSRHPKLMRLLSYLNVAISEIEG
jgi:hypothetical protein